MVLGAALGLEARYLGLAAVAVVLGHVRSVFLGFEGGKGVATFLGLLLAYFFPLGLAACATWLATAIILRISSLSALRGVSGQAAYAASKAGLLAMTRCLAREMGRRDIRVNAVIPGYVATGMTAHLPAATVEQLRDPEVLKRGVTPEDVAGTVAFLLSDEASATTGQSLIVDAGNMA